MILVANKIDLEIRQLTPEDGKRWVKERDSIKFFETSAKENCNVEDIFSYIVRELRIKRKMQMDMEGGTKEKKSFWARFCNIL